MHSLLEVLTWRVSSWSAGGNCIEAASSKNGIYVRDTKKRSRGPLSFPAGAWKEFIRAIQTDSVIFK